ncbi:MAG TPA: ATP-binding cassette domain-containing protein [Candidatus Thalassarchaeaceae archaeon]|jgi:ABC-type phosphate/phosphonate transport system ATPase subunit|nr:ATP-binding cassette domain-containing protein [Candidatus Thalassarchaeaceae archaeon]HJM41382.1 ATP-binding cassette domain-containing protein [Candidatus Thalassarchaeaceae archaeon]
MPTPVLSIRQAVIGFEKDKPLLVDVNLDIHPGEIIGIIGRSGIGKSTLLRTIAGLLSPLSGDIDVPSARGEIGYIPQRLGLINHHNVGYNVMMGALARAPFWQTLFSLPGIELRESARSAIEAVGLSDKVLDSISQLSGGQQQRVAIARSMVQQPTLLLADECLGELDSETAKEIIELIQKLAQENNIAIIIVDHNPVRVATFCDRVLQVKGTHIEEVNV